MADGFSFSVDDRELLAALGRLGKTIERFTMPAAQETARRVQSHAKSFIAKRSGVTASGILMHDDYWHAGYVVRTRDTLNPGERQAQLEAGMALGSTPSKRRRWASRTYTQDVHVGLYLEKGTVKGKPRSHSSAPRPWLNPATVAEAAPHADRMRVAIRDGISAEGFGDR